MHIRHFLVLSLIISNCIKSMDSIPETINALDAWWSYITVNVQEISVTYEIDTWDIQGNSCVYFCKKDEHFRDLYHYDLNTDEENFVWAVPSDTSLPLALCGNKIVFKNQQQLHVVNKQHITMVTILQNAKKDPISIVHFACHPKLPLCGSIGTDHVLRVHNVDTGKITKTVHPEHFLKHDPESSCPYVIAWHPTEALIAVSYNNSLFFYNFDKGILWCSDNFQGTPYFSYHGDYVWGERESRLCRIPSNPHNHVQLKLIDKDMSTIKIVTMGASYFLTEHKTDGEYAHQPLTLRAKYSDEAKPILLFYRQRGMRRFPCNHDNRFILVHGKTIMIHTPET